MTGISRFQIIFVEMLHHQFIRKNVYCYLRFGDGVDGIIIAVTVLLTLQISSIRVFRRKTCFAAFEDKTLGIQSNPAEISARE
jgi:hypothetical protein